MTQKELLGSISKHLARFVTQVQISNSNNEYDINIHSENIIIPILNTLYGANLVNINYTDKNAEAIDLIDVNKRIAFQVTSTRSIEKIKSTLSKFLLSKYKNSIDKIYIYILTEKNNSYSYEPIKKIVDKKIKFDVKENILDAKSIYRQINELNDSAKIEYLESLLRYQFSDVYISDDFTINKFENFKSDYTKSCTSNFSRINFFGLSIQSNRPREIELYRLFVYPNFLTTKQNSYTSLIDEDYNLFKNINTKNIDSIVVNTVLPKINYDDKFEVRAKALAEYYDLFIKEKSIEINLKDFQTFTRTSVNNNIVKFKNLGTNILLYPSLLMHDKILHFSLNLLRVIPLKS